ncbi:MAG TPA: flavin reductase [Lachnospiraceae bacterium]|nr:flavin reductase [Lachnospiraceae bacterium]
MYCTRKVKDDLIWVGGNDRRLSLFEGVYSVPHGVSYNSYLLLDEKTILFDTVDKAIGKTFFENLEYGLGGRPLDYVVVHHMEPDHSASLSELLLRYPDVKVVCNEKTKTMIKNFFDKEVSVYLVKETDTLSTGKHSFRFYMAPMVHWPEVMVTYDETDKTLFSADAFGTFGALNGALFADEVDFEHDYLDEARRYYANIIGKYGPQVQAFLKKADALDIAMICPLHGFVWRENLEFYIEKYKKWSSYIPEETCVLMPYASIYGNTENIADIVSCRLRDKGIQTVMFDVSVAPASEIIAAAFKYSHIVFASATYNAGIFVSMEELIRDLRAHNIQNRTIGFIQNGSWAPASGRLMKEILADCKDMKVLEQTITVISSAKKEQEEEIEAFVNAVAETIPEADRSTGLPEKKTGVLDEKALFKLQYGLFVLTAKDGEKDNGCIVNTVQQVTSMPNRITVAVNKQNYTHDMILKSGMFNVSVLTESAAFELFQNYGFRSGRDCDKFEGIETVRRSANGLLYLTKNTDAVLSGKVVGSYDYGTHTIFIAEVTEAAILSEEPSVTYTYYFEHIKPKPEKKTSKGKVWVCVICGYQYDEEKEGTPFEELPADWLCPICKHPKSDFVLQE